MKAVVYRERGPARDVLSIEELAKPAPAPGEVLVRIEASGANPSDVKTRNGNLGPMTDALVVPHSDGAGVIEAVGDGVAADRIGERVWLYNVNRTADGSGQGANGTAAAYCALPERLVAPLPEAIGFDQGACLGVPAMTAHRAVFAEGSVKGKTLLVTGGAGAVGSLAVTMAKWGGARVLSTISSPAKAAVAQGAGADVTINYRQENLEDAVLEATNGSGVDRLIDVNFGVHINLTPRILKANSVIAAYASSDAPKPEIDYYPLMFNNTTIRLVFVYAMPAEAKEQAKSDITALLKDGRLSPLVAQSFPLEETAAAHELIESGKALGNVICCP